MQDFRSLEQKIRQVWLDEAEARNTALRKKVENVGRPDDNVKDETSKLAKQGEIQRKIIDEAGPETQPKEPKDEIKDKKPAKDKDTVDAKEIKGGKTEVDLNPTTDDRTEDGKKIDDVSKKATKKANREGGIQEGNSKMLKSDKTFGLPSDLIATVAEAMGKCPKCGKSPCQCDGDPKKIKEENLDEMKRVWVSPTGRNTHAVYGETPDGKVKRISGGHSEITAKVQAKKHAEKHGLSDKGGKGFEYAKSTNEEIEQIDEKLVGGQKKLDKNHNGKLDKQDFKILRGEKKGMKESSCACENKGPCQCTTLDEVSLKTKINAYKAASDHDADYSYGSKVHAQADRIHSKIVAKHGEKAGEHAHRAAYGKPSTPATRSAEKAKSDPLTNVLSKTHKMRTTKSGVAHKQDQKYNASVIKSRLGKHGKSKLPEHVEFSTEELARIEEIAKSL